MKTQFQLKRVYDPATPDDGYRVLIDRLWPRGINKQDLHYDLWAKELAPSSELRKWYHLNPQDHWTEFRRKYRSELHRAEPVTEFLRTVHSRPVVTLLYGAKDREHNHAVILKEYLEKAL